MEGPAEMEAVKAGAEAAEMAGGKRSAWMTHLKKTMRANKGLSLGKAMKLAKKTYKKIAKKTRRGGAALSPAAVGGRRRQH